MKKSFIFIFYSFSLIAMQTEQEKWEATCKEWGKYLMRAAQAAQAEAAMVYQIAANMKRERCQNEIEGRINRNRFQNLSAFKEAGATLFCYTSANTLYCIHNCQESDPISYCNFKFENELKRSS